MDDEKRIRIITALALFVQNTPIDLSQFDADITYDDIVMALTNSAT